MDIAHSHAQMLGKSESVWFKLSNCTNTDQPMQVLARITEKYGGVVPINLKGQDLSGQRR